MVLAARTARQQRSAAGGMRSAAFMREILPASVFRRRVACAVQERQRCSRRRLSVARGRRSQLRCAASSRAVEGEVQSVMGSIKAMEGYQNCRRYGETGGAARCCAMPVQPTRRQAANPPSGMNPRYVAPV